jgi:hypothetical protein
MVRNLRQARGQGVGVQRSDRGQRAQHDQIERALQQLDLVPLLGMEFGRP